MYKEHNCGPKGETEGESITVALEVRNEELLKFKCPDDPASAVTETKCTSETSVRLC